MSSAKKLSEDPTALSLNNDIVIDIEKSVQNSAMSDVFSRSSSAQNPSIPPPLLLQSAHNIFSPASPIKPQTRSFEENLRDWVQCKTISSAESKERQRLQKRILDAHQNRRDLSLRNSILTSLPDGLSIGGELILSGCEALLSLPEELNIGGALSLDYCKSLKNLPKKLHVGGNLDLYGCTGLTYLPRGLSVGRNFYLTNCTGLMSLPEDLHIRGNLDLRNCTGLTILPEILHVGGNFSLRGCSGIFFLNSNILTWGAKENGEKRQIFLQDSSISFAFIEYIQKANPAGIQFYFPKSKDKAIDDDFAANLRDWVQAKEIIQQESQERQRVQGLILASQQTGGSLLLADCASLTSLPNKLSIDGDLVLDGCINLIRLPESLSISGDLGLYGCRSLTDLPEKIRVGGNIFMNNCTSLISLPKGLKVSGYLGLYGCVSLTNLPERLRVDGGLGLGDCIGLRSLPQDLSVGGSIDLRGCSGITFFPPNMDLLLS